MMMFELWDRLKNVFTYDADRDFYAQVFPDSVTKVDLMRIRKMRRADFARVLDIEQKNYDFPWGEETFKDCFAALSYSCWVCAEPETERVVAYAILSVAAGEAHVLNISVAPEVQGEGVGRKMMRHLIDTARKNAQTLFLEVRVSNHKAQALYQSLGFNEIGLRKGYYPAKPNSREDAMMLALELV